MKTSRNRIASAALALVCATLATAAHATAVTGKVNAIVRGAKISSDGYQGSSGYSCLVLEGKIHACWINDNYRDGSYYFDGSALPPAMPELPGTREIEFGARQICAWDTVGIECLGSESQSGIVLPSGGKTRLMVAASEGIRSLFVLKADWGKYPGAMREYDGYSDSRNYYSPVAERFCAMTDAKGMLCWATDGKVAPWPAPVPAPQQIVVTWTRSTTQVPGYYSTDKPVTVTINEPVTCTLDDGEVICQADPALSLPAPGTYTRNAPDFKLSKRLLPVPPLGPVSEIRIARLSYGGDGYNSYYPSHVCARSAAGETCWTYWSGGDRYVVNSAGKPQQNPSTDDAAIDTESGIKFVDGWISKAVNPLDALSKVVYESKSKPLSALSAFLGALPAAKNFLTTDPRVGSYLWLLNAWAPVIESLNAHAAEASAKQILGYRDHYNQALGFSSLAELGLPSARSDLRAATYFTLGATLEYLSASVQSVEIRAAMQKLAADFAAATAKPVESADLVNRLSQLKPTLVDLSLVGRAKGFALTALSAAAYLEAK